MQGVPAIAHQNERPCQASGDILPKGHVRWLGKSGQQLRLSPGASGWDPLWPEFPMAFQGSWSFGPQ
ncbi:hypothetical protein TNCV_3102951 [Trichonephila clavipes]|nr:hypothetical protein TNCV_3102951 [Trichonephila clavipes]